MTARPTSLHRRHFLKLSLAGAFAACCEVVGGQEPQLDWHNVEEWGVEGRGWTDVPRARYFDRLPAEAEGVVRDPVWQLSRHSAGMAVRFVTDATQIWVDYELLSSRLDMPHMPATGVSGLDLYATDEDGELRWVQVTRPETQQIKTQLVTGLDAGRRTYMLYLPLYNGVNSLKIGVPSGTAFEGLAPRQERPLLFYGTSIMHGACASRPGMAIPAQLGRRFEMPTINLGFSGNGRMDPEVVDLIAKLDCAAYCIDCLPNMSADQVRERAMPLVKKLRAARPATPIVLVEDRIFSNARFFASRRKFHTANHEALQEAFETLRKEGVQNLHYLPGHDLIGSDGEGATDGSHPNDLGFMRYADSYQIVLRDAL